MYSDLFEHLGGGGSSGGGRRHHHHRGGAAAAATDTSEGGISPLVQFKAGKMVLTEKQQQHTTADIVATTSTTTAKPSFHCVADPTRGEVRLVWRDNQLQWQWYNRRESAVVDRFIVTDVMAGSTFERVILPSKKHAQDRIFVWTHRASSGSSSSSSINHDNVSYEMYWMQDASDEKDDDIVTMINIYLADPASAAPEGANATTGSAAAGGTTGTGTIRSGGISGTGPRASAMTSSSIGGGGDGRVMSAAGSSNSNTNNAATAASIDVNQSQVDALSSILENLGMPQNDSTTAVVAGTSSSAVGTGGAAAPSTSVVGSTTTTTSGGTLTLSDLQDAMASLQQAQRQQQAQQRSGGPSLAEVVTPAAITSLLQNEAACERFKQFLPEQQQDMLEENLRSPQVQQTLRSLTAALLPDDTGDLSGLWSVIANFHLDAADAEAALATQSPVQAFLDCILRSVDREQAATAQQQQQGEADEEEGMESGDGAADKVDAMDEDTAGDIDKDGSPEPE